MKKCIIAWYFCDSVLFSSSCAYFELHVFPSSFHLLDFPHPLCGMVKNELKIEGKLVLLK